MKDKREKLAIMLFCRSYLHIAGILIDGEADKVFARIRKYQDQNQIEITEEQLDSVEIIYQD